MSLSDCAQLLWVCLIRSLSSAEDRWLRLQKIKTSEQVRCENKLKELVFHVWKTSSLNSFFIHGKQVLSTRFSCLVHPIHLTRSRGTELEIEPARLDFRKWSPALHVLSWVPAGGHVCSLSVSLSQIEHFLAPIHFLAPLNLTLLSALNLSLSTLHY